MDIGDYKDCKTQGLELKAVLVIETCFFFDVQNGLFFNQN